ncbi:ArsO family NAD(P)H-dependent flavin-containing monooxygenase [Kutzneria sp. NPDC051319]|uniref:ArsO family NAD(P)H-dependent flavin-containing monooxygenase n=1 Tax=Kutzneria sp. NPDC051319 TaxID=3155047 RepID=UPI00343E1F7A
MTNTVPVVVVGGGQAGLAAGYYLRRAGVEFVILDDQSEAGGAWQHGWASLRLFSAARYSSLPGWPMPPQPGEPFPTADHVVSYLRAYEQRYELPIRRPIHVEAVRAAADRIRVETDHGVWSAATVISATGTWWRPYVPHCPGQADFAGRQLHTVSYRKPDEFAGQRVVVVGGGNSAAQILAEVSTVADVIWATERPPRFLPDDVDGRVLFDVATQQLLASRAGQQAAGVAGLGDIVVVPSVLAARERGVLVAEPMFERITEHGIVWADGRTRPADTIIWCTGFRPALSHLAPLGLSRVDGHIATRNTQAADDARIHLLGYGNWTGTASATLVGAGRTAKQLVAELTGRPRRSGTATF